MASQYRKGGNSIPGYAPPASNSRVPDFILTAGRAANNVVSPTHDAVRATAKGERRDGLESPSARPGRLSWLGRAQGEIRPVRGNDGYSVTRGVPAPISVF